MTNSKPAIRDYLLLGADQIDYANLSSDILLGLATQEEEPFVATNALGELARADEGLAISAASTVLAADPWDNHLRAFALSILHAVEPDEAAPIMQRELALCGKDPVILSAIAAAVLATPNAIEAVPQVVSALEARLATLSERELELIEDVEEFRQISR